MVEGWRSWVEASNERRIQLRAGWANETGDARTGGCGLPNQMRRITCRLPRAMIASANNGAVLAGRSGPVRAVSYPSRTTKPSLNRAWRRVWYGKDGKPFRSPHHLQIHPFTDYIHLHVSLSSVLSPLPLLLPSSTSPLDSSRVFLPCLSLSLFSNLLYCQSSLPPSLPNYISLHLYILSLSSLPLPPPPAPRDATLSARLATFRIAFFSLGSP